MEGCSYPEEQHTHTPHAAVTLPNNGQDKHPRLSEIPAGSSNNFSPSASTLPQEKELRTRLNTKRRCRSTVVGCRIFLNSIRGPNQSANNPTSACRLQVERTIKNEVLTSKKLPFLYQQSKCLGCLKLLRQEILRSKLSKTMLKNAERGAMRSPLSLLSPR